MSTPEGALAKSFRPVVERRLPPGARDVHVSVRKLDGGLVSDCVLQVCARFLGPRGRRRTTSFVLKRLSDSTMREARVYTRLLAGGRRRLAPKLYEVVTTADGAVYLCLEAVTPVSAWPWGDWNLAAHVLRNVGALHVHRSGDLERELGAWDYDGELESSAAHTLALLGARARHGDAVVRRGLPAAGRIRRSLAFIRRELQGSTLLPPAIIHGDLHPGNVIVRRARGGPEPILIDWARARVGSPLEDVAQWLQWLGFWEPQARRKHDTLLGAYLTARGLPRLPSREPRRTYWLAAALNCYAGVVAHYLSGTTGAEPARRLTPRAISAVHDCLRVIKRADSYL